MSVETLDDAFDDALRALSACRWMQPDASLEALDGEAHMWLEERVDELSAALSSLVFNDAALPSLSLTTVRSAPEACARWSAAWERAPAVPSPVLCAFEEAAAEATQRIATRHIPEALAALELRVRESLAHTLDAPSPWHAVLARHEADARAYVREPASQNPGRRHPAVHVATQHLRWVLAFGDDALTPSPWRPLVEVFARGAWPAVLPDDTVLVYVPVLRGAALVPEPSRIRQLRFPKRGAEPARLRAEFPTLSQLGVSTPPSVQEAEPPMMMMGRIAQVSLDPAAPPRRPPRR